MSRMPNKNQHTAENQRRKWAAASDTKELVFPCPVRDSNACETLSSSWKQKRESACHSVQLKGDGARVCVIFMAFRFTLAFLWSSGTSLTQTIYDRAETLLGLSDHKVTL